MRINIGVNVKNIVDKQECNKEFIWNPSNCNCKCNKSCNIAEYLDYKNCKCRKNAAYSLVEKCEENIDKKETLLIKEYKILNTSSSDFCRPYVVLFIVFLIITIIISSVFVSSYLYSRSKRKLQTYYY